MGQAFQFPVDRSCVMYYKLSRYNCLHLTITSQFLAAKILLCTAKQMIIAPSHIPVI